MKLRQFTTLLVVTLASTLAIDAMLSTSSKRGIPPPQPHNASTFPDTDEKLLRMSVWLAMKQIDAARDTMAFWENVRDVRQYELEDFLRS